MSWLCEGGARPCGTRTTLVGARGRWYRAVFDGVSTCWPSCIARPGIRLMTRYRPPAPPKAPYLTLEGAERLRAELKELWSVERPEVTAAVSAAALNGDRSENGDYIYGKKRLREIDSRVRYLRKRLEQCTIVAAPPDDPSRIFFGAFVDVEYASGQTRTLRIVGPDEITPDGSCISIDSPVARALLGRTIDDEVNVETPAGHERLWVLAVRYAR